MLFSPLPLSVGTWKTPCSGWTVAAVVTAADDRADISEGRDVEEALASAEGPGMVTLVSSDSTIEVTAETLTSSENTRVTGTGVAEECVAISCGNKAPAVKDIAVLSVGIVAKLVLNVLVVEAPRGSENVCVLPEVGDGAGFPSGRVSDVQCAL